MSTTSTEDQSRKMNKVFADTSFFLTLLIQGDAYATQSATFLSTFDGTIITTEYVLIEVGNHLSPRGQRHLYGRFVDGLRRHRKTTIVPAEPSWYEAGLALFRDREDKSWSLTDCITFQVMRQMGLTEALTLDHHFQQAGFQILPKYEA